jgi:hypothetical protein
MTFASLLLTGCVMVTSAWLSVDFSTSQIMSCPISLKDNEFAFLKEEKNHQGKVFAQSSSDENFFSYVLDATRSEDCRLLITYGGTVQVGSQAYGLLGTEYYCEDSRSYIVIESGGPYFFASIKNQ